MATLLNSLDSSKIVIIVSYEEPQANHNAGIWMRPFALRWRSALYIGSFLRRLSYILVGVPGIGYGQGLEYYKGSGDNDSTAHLCLR